MRSSLQGVNRRQQVMISSYELTRLEAEVSMVELLSRSGERATIHQGHTYAASCPACNSDAWLLPTGLFCNSTACSFLAGGPLEHVTALTGGDDVEALRLLRQTFEDRRELWSGDRDIFDAKLLAQAQARRGLVNFFLTLGRRGDARGDACLLAEATAEWRRHLGATQMTLYHAGPADMAQLCAYFDRCGIQHKFKPTQGAVLIPFMDRHHSIAAVLSYTPKDRRSCMLRLRPVRMAFSGLWDSSPCRDITYLTGSPLDALSIGAGVQLAASEAQAMGVVVWPDGEAGGYRPSRAIYCVGEGLLDNAAAYRRQDPSVGYINGRPGENECQTWESLVTERILRLVEVSGLRFSDPVAVIAQSADLNILERHALVQRLKACGFAAVAGWLSSLFGTQVILRANRLRLLETPYGYAVERDGSDARETVANFIFHPERNIHFDEGTELYHEGVASFQGQQYRLIVSSDDLSNPQRVQERMQQAVFRVIEEPDHLPVILDRSLFKYVATTWRERVSSLRSRQGVSQFGWHHSRKRFTAPGWRMDMDGLIEGQPAYHPDRYVLNYFDPKAEPPSAALRPERPPGGFADVARIVLAGVCRDFCAMDMQGVPVRQTRASQRMCEVVFGRLGQRRPVNATGPKPTGLNRWPSFGYDHDLLQLRQSPNFILGLGEHGHVLPGLDTASDADFEAWGDWLHLSIQQLVVQLLAEGAEKYARRRHVLFSTELIDEGNGILADVFGITDWPTSPPGCTRLEALLELTDKVDLPSKFAYDYGKQHVRIYHRRHDESDIYAHELELELRNLAPEVLVHEDYLAVSSPAVHTILRHWYGDDVRLPQLR